MSVIDRARLLEGRKDIKTTTFGQGQCSKGIALEERPSTRTSCTPTCDKHGSGIKATIAESKVQEEEITEEIESTLSDREGDVNDSDDESTVVRNRRDTLKSASRNVKRSLNVPTTIPANLFGAEPMKDTQTTTPMVQAQAHEEKEIGNSTEKRGSSISQRMKLFEKSNSASHRFTSRVPSTTKKLQVEPKFRSMSQMVECNVAQYNIGTSTGVDLTESTDDHPDIVAVQDDFSLRDDTSTLHSVSEQSYHQVVCRPNDRVPYYKKEKMILEASIRKCSMQGETSDIKTREIKSRSSSQTMDEDIGKMETTFKRFATAPRYQKESQSVEVSQLSEPAKDRRDSVESTQRQHLGVGRSRLGNNFQVSKPKVSSTISNKLAMFEKKPQPSIALKKRNSSLAGSVQQNSVDRTIFSDRRKSRKSSLSLQDVLDTRSNVAEGRKSSIHGAEPVCLDANESNQNVRPSELLKRVKENVAPARPSPLIGRRGFSRPSSGQNDNLSNLRCF
ncbi:MAG: hypothetical protein SGILL_000677 [Bacillariaceae sp.]